MAAQETIYITKFYSLEFLLDVNADFVRNFNLHFQEKKELECLEWQR